MLKIKTVRSVQITELHIHIHTGLDEQAGDFHRDDFFADILRRPPFSGRAEPELRESQPEPAQDPDYGSSGAATAPPPSVQIPPPPPPDTRHRRTHLETNKIPDAERILLSAPGISQIALATCPPGSGEARAGFEIDAAHEIFVPITEFFKDLHCGPRATGMARKEIPADKRLDCLAWISFPGANKSSSTLCANPEGLTLIMSANLRSAVNGRLKDEAVSLIQERFDRKIKACVDACRALRLGIFGIEGPEETIPPYTPKAEDLVLDDLYKLHPSVPRDFIKDYLVQQGIILRKALKWGESNIRSFTTWGAKHGFTFVRMVKAEMVAAPGSEPGSGYKLRPKGFFTDRTAQLLARGPGLRAESEFIETEYANHLFALGEKTSMIPPIPPDLTQPQ